MDHNYKQCKRPRNAQSIETENLDLNIEKSNLTQQVKGLQKEVKKIKDIFDESSNRYGYRRIHSVLKSTGVTVSEKVVHMIMNTDNLKVPNIKLKRYSSYKGEISPEVNNLTNRNFHAIGTSPNSKLVNTMLDNALSTLKETEKPIVHSDRGCHVRQEVA